MTAPRYMLLDVETGSYRELRPSGGVVSSENGRDRKLKPWFRNDPTDPADPRVFDPYRIARDFPERWQAYLHAHFRNPTHVARVFFVSEPAARKWWEGKGSCHADKAAIAVALHPRVALDMLYGIAAE